MRELIARVVSAVTVSVLVSIALWFAWAHNSRFSAAPAILRPEPPATGKAVTPILQAKQKNGPRAAEPTPPQDVVERGRAIFAQQGCSSCHSVAGEGNPRLPLDHVGDQFDSAELSDWTTGSGFAADRLPAAIVKRKQRYQSLPRDDLNALIAYLSSLRAAK